MKTSKKITLLLLIGISSIACKNEPGNAGKIPQNAKELISKKPKSTKERKIVKGTVEATVAGNAFRLTELDQKASTDVVLLDNGIQFRIDDQHKQTVLVNMYAPDLLQKIPISISQQTASIPADKVYSVAVQSRLELVIPSDPPMQGDTKELYEGIVTLEQLTEDKLVVTFQGKGLAMGSSKQANYLFPMEGKIVLEDFNVYDGRMKD